MDAFVANFKAWAELVAFVATIIGAPIAVWAIRAQSRSSRVTDSFDNLWKFKDDWESKEMHTSRVVVSNGVLSDALPAVEDDVRAVLDFFETMGLLSHKGAIHLDVAWNRFAVWAIHYWLSLNPWLVDARRRQKDETLWAEYERLQQELIQTDAKQRNRTVDQVREDYKAARRDFLKRESLLRIA